MRGKPANARGAATGRRVQLHRALSKLGWGSRTQAMAWIRNGEVRVDGRVVTDPLTWVDLERQQITRRGKQAPGTPLVVLALHKPKGIVTTRNDERGRRTVYDLLPSDLPWVFPAGRLDADSEGLLIFTNDAKLAERLTEPQLHVTKTYLVTIRGALDADAMEKLRKGVELAEGKTRPCTVRVVRSDADATVLEMILTEGRNRQIRRMLAAVGHKVRRLIRVAIGRYRLDDLQCSSSKQLSSAEIALLSKRE